MDRKKDMIIRSGLKVYPAKVEKVLRTHKLVSDACVVGRADTVHTEVVVAVLVLSGEVQEHDRSKIADELRALCREHLAPYEVPAQFEFVAQLPRSPLGKLLRRELRQPMKSSEAGAAAGANGNGHPKTKAKEAV
jgi:long-chain acyl-CoA synthetase